jgi:hypothetical protein
VRRLLFTTEPSLVPNGQWEVVAISQPDDDRRVIAAAQALLSIEETVVLGGHGAMARLLPRIGFARRAARRPIEEYVLIDGDLPAVAGDWPDAPVRFIATHAAFTAHAKVARERGWNVDAEY